jgi:G3E family GTPase
MYVCLYLLVCTVCSSHCRYGISSFTFRSKRPFHPARLHTLLEGRRTNGLSCVVRSKGFLWLPTRMDNQVTLSLDACVGMGVVGLDLTCQALFIFFSKGFCIAVLLLSLNLQCVFALAGRLYTLGDGALWWATVPKDSWPENLERDIASLWDPEFGDRQQEFVVIGRNMDGPSVSALFDACLLTDDEMANRAAWEAWPDPFLPVTEA